MIMLLGLDMIIVFTFSVIYMLLERAQVVPVLELLLVPGFDLAENVIIFVMAFVASTLAGEMIIWGTIILVRHFTIKDDLKEIKPTWGRKNEI